MTVKLTFGTDKNKNFKFPKEIYVYRKKITINHTFKTRFPEQLGRTQTFYCYSPTLYCCVLQAKFWGFAVSDVYAAMGKPGGGRNEVDPRFISMFSVYCMVFPSDDTINHIFHSILSGHTSNFNDNVKSVIPIILQMTLNLYKVN